MDVEKVLVVVVVEQDLGLLSHGFAPKMWF